MSFLRRIAVLCVAISVLPAAAATKPKVNVSFLFDATMYTGEDMTNHERETVAGDAVKAFIDNAGGQAFYPFITWVSNEPNAENGVTLALTSKTGQRGQLVYLEYRCRIDKKDRGKMLTEQLFGENDGKFTTDPTTLSSRITALVKNRMEALRNTVVSEIAIATKVDLNSRFRKVIVPFPACLLEADAEKVLLDVFFTPKGTQLSERMRLYDPSQNGATSLACRIDNFRYRDLKLDRQNDWSPRLPQVFSASTVSINKVTVYDYHYQHFVSKMNDDGEQPCN